MDVLITGRQSRMARAAFDLSLPELTKETGLGVNTIGRFEATGSARVDTVRRLVAAYRARGIEFPDNQTVRVRDLVEQSAA
jgi:hypothetical protein